MAAKTAIRPEDIYELRSPGVVSLSPDGRRLVVAVGRASQEKLTNLSQLWMIDLERENDSARPFTQGNWVDAMPKWSPTGQEIAFLSNRSGKMELWLIPADGGEARQLSKLEGSISDFDWDRKGVRLVVSFTPRDPDVKEREQKKKLGEPGADGPAVREIGRLFYKLDGAGFLPKSRSYLWIIDAKTGRGRQLTADDTYDEAEPRFARDGRSVFFVSNRTPEPDRELMRVDLWRVTLRGGAIEKVRTFDGPTGSAALSPDGEWIAFFGKRDPNQPWNQHHDKLWLVPAKGGRPVELTAKLDRGVGNTAISDTFGMGAPTVPHWSPDSNWIYFSIANEGSTEVWAVDRRKPAPKPVLSRPGVVIDFALDFERGRIHSSFSSLENPGEIWSDPLRVAPANKTGGAPTSRPIEPTQRTAFNAWLERRKVAIPDEFWFTGKSRNQVQGWVLNPPGVNRARQHAGILYIHGGPATQYARIYFHEFQVLAASGYVVLYSNPRGGTGYSERHLNSIVDQWGTHDYDDLMDFTDVALRKNRHLSRRRLAVGGGSYGGFMTNWIIGHTDRFACAITQRSISNLMSFVGSSDFGYYWPNEFGSKGPWENPQHYLKRSPLTYLKNMKTPTLIEHQEEDHRCPIEQAEQLWSALKWKGVPVEFLRYPAEPHGMSRNGRPDRRIDRMQRILAWLGKWTKAR